MLKKYLAGCLLAGILSCPPLAGAQGVDVFDQQYNLSTTQIGEMSGSNCKFEPAEETTDFVVSAQSNDYTDKTWIVH